MSRSHVGTRALPGRRLPLRALIGSGDRIALFTLPFALVALALWSTDHTRFAVDASSPIVQAIVVVTLAVGLVGWAWSAWLIRTRVPKGELITNGPFAVVKHPLYTSVGLLVLPSAGILLGSWVGVVIGLALYAGARLFAPAEERQMRSTFGPRWEAYEQRVLLPWL
jgi:protein-S-isoprenylcysteine O-methyltransferase Ste14